MDISEAASPAQSLDERLHALTHKASVVLFMKGTPDAPRCGFSRQAVALLQEAKVKFARRRVPARRYAEPEEVAHGILHLALPASSYITGHLLMVDGGMTVKNN